MTVPRLQSYLASMTGLVTKALEERRVVPCAEDMPLVEAMREAVLCGGKRLRPLLSLAVADLRDAPPGAVLDAACAVEMAHAASLILDDLPCMDDAKERRGQPCTHVRYGVATAVLAAVGLLSEAYRLVARNGGERHAHAAVAALSDALGMGGLVMGQHLDLTLGDGALTPSLVERVHHMKAGALFILAARLPAVLLDFRPEERAAVEAYALHLGLAFQIGDDLLDAGEAGRPNLADQSNRGAARQRLDAVIRESHAALTPLGGRAECLKELAEHVRTRTQ